MSTKEGVRDTTITDARKLGLYPSTTTIIGLLNKPLLNNWRVEQGIKAVMTAPHPPPLLDSEEGKAFIKEAIKQSEEYVTYAADFGIAVHQGIACGLVGEQAPYGLLEVAECLDGFWPWFYMQGFEVDKAEHTFVNTELGYAGTLDFLGWHQGKRTLADFKTSDFAQAKDAPFYPEYPLQLASYALGISEPEVQRMSIQISRTHPGLVVTKVWPDNARYDAAWLDLLSFWQRINQWPW